jgi:hypothetical protein
LPSAEIAHSDDSVTKERRGTAVSLALHFGGIMRIQTTWIVIVGTLIAGGGFVLAVIGFFAEKNTTMGITGAIITIAAIIGTILLYRRAASAGRPQFEQAIKTDFNADDWGWFDGSGLAVDRTRKLILLGTAQGTQRIPFAQIGSVTYHATKTGPAVGGNSILALILIPFIISAMVHNARKAGMHLVINGQPTRIAGMQPKDADRWQSHLAAAQAG